MVLPASQYSVLDARRVERLDEDTFRCHVGALRFFSLEVEPVITVSVTVQERGPTVRLLSTKVCVGGQRRICRACTGLAALRSCLLHGGFGRSCLSRAITTRPRPGHHSTPCSAAQGLQGR